MLVSDNTAEPRKEVPLFGMGALTPLAPLPR